MKKLTITSENITSKQWSTLLIELNLIKPKTKVGLNLFLNLLSKWRNDLFTKKFKHM